MRGRYELSIVTMEECSSWNTTREVEGSKGERYIVFIDGPEAAHCDCRGFKFRGECKHLNALFKELCLWHQQWCEETSKTEGVCPRCGGATVFVRCAV